MALAFGVLVLVALGIWAAYTYFYEGNLDQPEYALVSETDGVEFRQYKPFIIATTHASEAGESGLRSGFRVLAKFIFGGNQQNESMAMTAPVMQQRDLGESLPMANSTGASPGGPGGSAMTVAFVMPPDRGLGDLPAPNSDDVTLAEVTWGEVAAKRFSGSGSQERFRDVEAELRQVLKHSGRTPSGPAVYAQYNSPWAFPPLRRNEVLVPLTPQ